MYCASNRRPPSLPKCGLNAVRSIDDLSEQLRTMDKQTVMWLIGGVLIPLGVLVVAILQYLHNRSLISNNPHKERGDTTQSQATPKTTKHITVWIFQDMPTGDLLARMADEAPDGNWHWNPRADEIDGIHKGDIVLLWQPSPDETVRGIYAFGCTTSEPCNVEGTWRVNIKVQKLSSHLSKRAIYNEPQLRSLDIIQHPQGHRVFLVTEPQWRALQNRNFELKRFQCA